MTASATNPLQRRRTVAFLAGAIFLAALMLYAHPLLFPVLSQDDFQILAQSWTWQKTVDGLWTPNNEHAMPLGRLLTFVVVQLAGRPTALPFAGVLTGVVGLLIGMALTYAFVRRELGHPLYGLTALILFGVSSVYQQAVYWFAASFSVYALATVLLALLAAQRYRQTGRGRWLFFCGLCCTLSPCWFASGVLAGPLCCLYLLPRDDVGLTRLKQPWHTQAALAPLLGTTAFLAVSLPLTAGVIQHLEHYRNQNLTAVEAFQPLTGAWYTVRSVVDNLALGVFGITWVTVGPFVAPLLFIGLIAVGVWWARRSPHRRLALLGAGLIFGSYLLIYSGRAMWNYDEVGMFTPSWSRYHLQPQLGLALLICGGLPAWDGRWFRLDAGGRLTPRQTRALAWLLALCFLAQAPRGLLCYYTQNPRQAATLRRIERTSAFCKAHRISADAARRELGDLKMPESNTIVDGWDFLRGSDDPKDWSPEEVREMLNPDSPR
jgi:MFS family permease